MGVVLAAFLTPIAAEAVKFMADENSSYFPLIYVIVALGITAIIFFGGNIPCSFSADNSRVIMKVWCFRKVIEYEDIEDIEVTHEYISDRRSYYREYISFCTKKGYHSWWRIMDIDLTVTVSDRTYIQRQLDDGDFVKLRNYILARKA